MKVMRREVLGLRSLRVYMRIPHGSLFEVAPAVGSLTRRLADFELNNCAYGEA